MVITRSAHPTKLGLGRLGGSKLGALTFSPTRHIASTSTGLCLGFPHDV